MHTLRILIAVIGMMTWAVPSNAAMAVYDTPVSTAQLPADVMAKIKLPVMFRPLIDAYNSEGRGYNSVYGFMGIAFWTGDGTPLVSAAKTYVFLRSESSFNALVDQNAEMLRNLLEPIYLGQALQTIISVPYTNSNDYDDWYACMMKVTPSASENPGAKRVLRSLAKGFDGSPVSGPKGECMSQLLTLSSRYVSGELTVDELLVLGFLNRRDVDYKRNSRFVSPETIRQAIERIMKSD